MIKKIKILERFKKDELTKSGAMIFAASLIAGFFNYLYQIYMGRALGPEEYGIFGALFAIFYIINIISQTIGTSTTRFVAKFISDGKNIGFFIKASLKRFIFIGIIVAMIFYSLKNGLIDVFKLKDHWPIIVLSFILFLSWIDPIMNGAVRGVQLFDKLSFVNASNSFFKLVFGVLFVALGFGVSGALMGVAIGTMADLAMSTIYVKPYIKPNNPHEPEFKFRDFYIYSLPVMIAMIGFSIPGNLDVILAKYYFSAIDAGIYTSVSTLGKIILFLPGAIGTIMFPMIIEKTSKGEKIDRILAKSLVYTGLLSGTVALLYLLFPTTVMQIFGKGYARGIEIVGLYGMAMFFFSLTVIFMNYHLAVKNMRYITFFIGFTVVEVGLLAMFHYSIFEMTDVMVIGNLILLVASAGYTYRRYIYEVINL